MIPPVNFSKLTRADTLVAKNYYESGDRYFCIFTIVIMFLPAILQGLIELPYVLGCFYKSWSTYSKIWKRLLLRRTGNIILQLPIIHAFEKLPTLVELSTTCDGDVEQRLSYHILTLKIEHRAPVRVVLFFETSLSKKL